MLSNRRRLATVPCWYDRSMYEWKFVLTAFRTVPKTLPSVLQFTDVSSRVPPSWVIDQMERVPDEQAIHWPVVRCPRYSVPVLPVSSGIPVSLMSSFEKPQPQTASQLVRLLKSSCVKPESAVDVWMKLLASTLQSDPTMANPWKVT